MYVYISGMNKIQALQLEWRLKKIKSPRTNKLVPSSGIKQRAENIYTVLNLTKWTSNAAAAETIPLQVIWYCSEYIKPDEMLPHYITQGNNVEK